MPPSPSCCVDRAGRRLTLRSDGTLLVQPQPITDAPAQALDTMVSQGDVPAGAGEGLTLVVADVHLGKVEQFQALGVPLPHAAGPAARQETLARLAQAVMHTRAQRLVVLGDLFHGPASGPALPGLVDMLGGCCADLAEGGAAPELVVIGGNHDTRAGLDLGPLSRSGWRLTLLPEHEPYWLGGDARAGLGALALTHHPRPVAGAAYTLAGHWHPCVSVRGRAHDRLRLPCFWLGAEKGPAPLGILPAFGAFTGMHPIERREGDEVYATAGDTVLPVPAAGPGPLR